MIKDKLIHPYLDVDLLYYHLSMESRDRTNDRITVDAANKTREVGVAVKCATNAANSRKALHSPPQTATRVAFRHFAHAQAAPWPAGAYRAPTNKAFTLGVRML